MNRIAVLAKKEFRHLFRDMRMLAVLLLFPAFLLLIFGFAVNFDIQNINLGIYDNDKTPESRELINSFYAGSYFIPAGTVNSYAELQHYIEKKKAQAFLVIPEGYAERLKRNEDSKVQAIIDGVDGNTATIIQNYMTSVVQLKNAAVLDERAKKTGINFTMPLVYQPRIFFNPELKSTRFLIPGLIGMILIITAVVSVSLSLVREKERGTIEQISVSPVHPVELIIGKSIPYVVLSFANALFVLIMGYFVFDVAVRGSLLILFGSILLFLVAAISLGIFISTVADSQQVAFTIATFTTLLPSIMLSGFIFQIESMPKPVQVLSNITPAKYFIVILRGVILRGAGIDAYWDQILYLVLFSVLFLTLATVLQVKKQRSV